MVSNAESRATVAANVRAELARRGRTQGDVAALLGPSQTAISRRLLGKVDFTAPELISLAEFLEVPVSRFFEDADVA